MSQHPETPGTDPEPVPAEPVLAACREAGFLLAGVAPARPAERPEALRAWLADGCHGEMAWLERFEPLLQDPARLLPGVRSIIAVGDRYADGRPDPATDAPFGRIARYARGRDYHRGMQRRLEAVVRAMQAWWPDAAFRVCVDTAPVLEREHAARAGLGAIGRNTLLLAPGIGSWFLLGEILTTRLIRPTEVPPRDPCGTCTRCIDACPTGAIAPWKVDATRCIAYLTIEHRGEIPARFHAAIGDWIFGCDICQEVCPHCQPTRRARRAPRHADTAVRRDGFDLLEVLGWDEESRRRAFETSALKRAKLAMIRRNAVIALGNHLARRDDPAIRARLRAIADDPGEDPIVVGAARAVISRWT
ncbi:MAG: tRNA epoxyqueuosine(34) reductase QueG [Phycisphaeraceae bacterium]|nr:tRNA epoxyqueuosine(34) reductase QueG [Phycisphaeraceae bacterium]